MADTELATRIVTTPQGPIEGTVSGGVLRCLGVPYGTAERFRPARRPAPWTDAYPAHELGDRCPQAAAGYGSAEWMDFLSDPSPMSEDCLRFNIYAPDRAVDTPRPVMVWLHGGGFVTGSGGRPGVEGSALANDGDTVVFCLNHRLNAFGFTYFGDIVPGHDGANLSLTDIICALEWIRDNAAAFGGDPSNVTLFGQSGGGGKIAGLMAMPAARGLFHRAVIQSASTLLRMATPERATRMTRLLLDELGIDDPTPEALAKPTQDEILAARTRAVARNDGVDDFRPVVDGETMISNPFEEPAISLSADIPLLIGVCEDEITFFLAGADPTFYEMSEDTARTRIAQFVGLEGAEADRLYSGLKGLFPAATPGQLCARALSEHMYRRNDRRAADLRSEHGGAPVYSYLFTWRTAALDGHLGAPHCTCIPFIFGTTDAAQKMLGRPVDARVLSDKVRAAWAAFARTGDPNTGALPDWPTYDTANRATMIFDDSCKVLNDPMPELRQMFDALPPYSTDRGAATLRKTA